MCVSNCTLLAFNTYTHFASATFFLFLVAPAIQIVIEGGLNTIKQVLSSLKSCSDNPVKDNSDNLIMPVVVVKGSGRAADILAYAYTLDLSEGNAHTDAGAKDELRLRKNIMLRMPGMTVAQQLSIFHNVKLCMDKKEYVCTVFCNFTK